MIGTANRLARGFRAIPWCLLLASELMVGGSTARAEPSALVPTNTGPRELLVLDARVESSSVLLDALRDGVDVVRLGPEDDAWLAISEAARGRDLSAIHLVGHGAPGSIVLGASVMTSTSVRENEMALSDWFAGARTHGELLLYGCASAENEAGAALLAALHDATGADVAGSTDPTGGTLAGGDFDLERSIGEVQTPLPFRRSIAREYPARLDIYPVTHTGDSGSGSLREAINQANCRAGLDRIVFTTSVEPLPAGPCGSLVQGLPDDSGVETDGTLTGIIVLSSSTLVVTDSVRIEGPGAELLAISGNEAMRIFEVVGTANVDVTLTRLRLEGGSASDGGAIECDGADLFLTDLVIAGNHADSFGGAIALVNFAAAMLTRCELSGNDASSGGAIDAFQSSCTIVDSTFSNNSAVEYGGGINVFDGTVIVRATTLTGNSADIGGGFFDYQATVVVEASTLSHNVATTAAAGMGVFGLGSEATVQLSTISGNISPRGAAIDADEDADLSVEASTLAANSLTGAGNLGAVRVGSGTIATFSSSILGDNLGSTGSAADLEVRPTAISAVILSTLVESAEGDLKRIPSNWELVGVDPKLGPLANNGGPTDTHEPLATSPAIERGTNALALTYDQRGEGYPRAVGAAADLGSVERQLEPEPDAGVELDAGISEDSGVVIDPPSDGGLPEDAGSDPGEPTDPGAAPVDPRDAGSVHAPLDGGVDGGAPDRGEGDGCGCSVVGSQVAGHGNMPYAVLLAVVSVWVRRRKRRSRRGTQV